MLINHEDLFRAEQFWYLASPYTDADSSVRATRAFAVYQYHSWFLRNKIWTLPTIWLTHQCAVRHNMPFTALDWEGYNRMWMDNSCGTIIAAIDGWKASAGILQEFHYTQVQDKPIILAKLNDDEMILHRLSSIYAES